MATESFLDTNVILRYLLRDDPKFIKQADEIFTHSPLNSLEIPSVIFAEVAYVMRGKGYSRQQIAIGLVKILDNKCVNQAKITNMHTTLELYLKFPRLDFADCYLAARAIRTKKKLATFDKDLQKVLRQYRR